MGLHDRLNEIYVHMMNDNPSRAHLWRTQLLRSAFPDLQTSAIIPTEVMCPKNASEGKVRQLYSKFYREFLQGSISSLLQELTQDEARTCASELHRIYIQAGNLQNRLQTHAARFEWCEPSECAGLTFTVDSEWFKADHRHRLEDDEDSSHDGQTISIVLSPPVTISGDHNGENYDKFRVVAKGLVYLQDLSFPKDLTHAGRLGGYHQEDEDEDGHVFIG
ncbi:Kinesin heavy chain [Lasiodiplodia theobromae]|uniref:Kinesin heavy chain n=1 Tax=Lasiodiplodia theobromae TaxID=45133 RepID=UPI0015C3B7F6|nr:Kinesin heavy chain [Lasiodiplodia theobromae]KAF4537852.1 Kinesin heavy chain [Lasiodiplodia theobromae]